MWNTERGFGFIFSEQINRRIFFHIKDWNRKTGNDPEPRAGDEVNFEIASSRVPGKPDVAVNVTPTGVNAFTAKAGV